MADYCRTKLRELMNDNDLNFNVWNKDKG
jgi:hypothetical protein